MKSMLQWGRARASAEMKTATQTLCGCLSLQWGRARASAEISEQMVELCPGIRLQWGRARASAEMPRNTGSTSAIGKCFNGAALVRARKCA